VGVVGTLIGIKIICKSVERVVILLRCELDAVLKDGYILNELGLTFDGFGVSLLPPRKQSAGIEQKVTDKLPGLGLPEPLAKLGLGLFELQAFCLGVAWNCCHILNSVANS